MRHPIVVVLCALSTLIAWPALSQQRATPSSPVAGPAATAGRVVSLIDDRDFKLGLWLQSPDQQDRSNIGTLYPFQATSSRSPVWTLAQWHGQHPLLPSQPTRLPDGGMEYRNEGKRVVFGPGPHLILGLKGTDRAPHTSKFVDKLKTTVGIAQDTWVPGGAYYRLSDMEHLRLAMTARLLKAESPRGATRETAAVAFVGLHIRNIHPARRDLVEFVLPLYDSRERTRRAVRLVDAATGGRFFIYGTGNEALIGNKSFHDRQWITIDKDILPLVKDALAQARRNPKFAEYSASLADYTISQMTIRWEVSADMDVEMEFKDFDLQAQLKPSTPIISIAASPDRLPKGASTTIAWNAANVGGDCVVKEEGAVVGKGNAGRQRSRAVDKGTTFALECPTTAGGVERRSVAVRAVNAACTISARPESVRQGGQVELSWQSGHGGAATIAPGIGTVPPSGTRMVQPSGRTNFIMTVHGPGKRPEQCNVVVPVLAE